MHMMWQSHSTLLSLQIENKLPISKSHLKIMSSLPNNADMQKLKRIDIESKSIVFGYIRQISTKLTEYNVPIVISFICLAFHFCPECFENCGKDIEIIDNGKTIQKIRNRWNYENITYGNKWVYSMRKQIVKWTFKVDKLYRYDSWISIGIVGSDIHLNRAYVSREFLGIPSYFHKRNGQLYKNGEAQEEVFKLQNIIKVTQLLCI